MKLGLDTSVLVHAHVASTPEHGRVRSYLLGELRRPDCVFHLTVPVLHEFVHVVTDGRRFDPPVTVEEATATARGWLGRSNVRCLAVGDADLALALDLIERHRLGRRRLADTLLAATLLRGGVTTLATCNVPDFAVFDELRLVNPLAG